ncbi:hypothetical protein [Deinococcus ruber]|uniref:Uncharacterized protein n=1 Tax=Deinococcus ruber TaxID=1848197 RepID=A0A918FIR3_9DEIO|nr:hypothetical protein [Deinococcus ruber]GGR40154.1 hypothetical protein GCM10008957_55910 [Deinococcus ruber]
MTQTTEPSKAPTSQTLITATPNNSNSAMKRARLIAQHLPLLNRLQDLRSVLLLQTVMKTRGNLAAVFNTDLQTGTVTVTLLGGQSSDDAVRTVTYRNTEVDAGKVLEQLRALTGLTHTDPAFSTAQVNTAAQQGTSVIEHSSELQAFDDLLLAIGTIQRSEPASSSAVLPQEAATRATPTSEAIADEPQEHAPHNTLEDPQDPAQLNDEADTRARSQAEVSAEHHDDSNDRESELTTSEEAQGALEDIQQDAEDSSADNEANDDAAATGNTDQGELNVPALQTSRPASRTSRSRR